MVWVIFCYTYFEKSEKKRIWIIISWHKTIKHLSNSREVLHVMEKILWSFECEDILKFPLWMIIWLKIARYTKDDSVTHILLSLAFCYFLLKYETTVLSKQIFFGVTVIWLCRVFAYRHSQTDWLSIIPRWKLSAFVELFHILSRLWERWSVMILYREWLHYPSKKFTVGFWRICGATHTHTVMFFIIRNRFKPANELFEFEWFHFA